MVEARLPVNRRRWVRTVSSGAIVIGLILGIVVAVVIKGAPRADALPVGSINTIVGGGSTTTDGTPATSAGLGSDGYGADAVATDSAGDLFIADEVGVPECDLPSGICEALVLEVPATSATKSGLR